MRANPLKKASNKIDITMTSVLRPSIVEETLKSFCKNIFIDRDRYRLIINIDLVGEDVKAKEILKVCARYFNKVIHNIPREPSFPKAVIWAWSQTTADWVFHLEDDWLITRPVDIDDMLSILKSNSSISALRMYKRDMPEDRTINLFGSIYRFDTKGFFVSNNSIQFVLNPSLIRGKFIHQAIQLMVDNRNPEKQFKDGLMRELTLRWKHGIYGKPGDKALVCDIGKSSRSKMGFEKAEKGANFLVWNKKGR